MFGAVGVLRCFLDCCDFAVCVNCVCVVSCGVGIIRVVCYFGCFLVDFGVFWSILDAFLLVSVFFVAFGVFSHDLLFLFACFAALRWVWCGCYWISALVLVVLVLV